jgi:hypothetical protein
MACKRNGMYWSLPGGPRQFTPLGLFWKEKSDFGSATESDKYQ